MGANTFCGRAASMLIKVDLHPNVVWFVRHQCNNEEQSAFFRELEETRKQPIARSEVTSDPKLGQYMLRFFRFAHCLAVFEYDVAKEKIKVLECRRVRPPKRSRD
jgi:hypothetical protein